MESMVCPVCRDRYLVPFLSNNLKNSSDTANTTTNASYEKVKEISFPAYALSGQVRIKFTLATNNASIAAYGRIYKDDVAIGTERTTTSTTGEEFSEDLMFTPKSKIQIYAKIAAGGLATVTNFGIYCSALCLSCGYDDSQSVKHIW